jgi:hypothetical protein
MCSKQFYFYGRMCKTYRSDVPVRDGLNTSLGFLGGRPAPVPVELVRADWDCVDLAVTVELVEPVWTPPSCGVLIS